MANGAFSFGEDQISFSVLEVLRNDFKIYLKHSTLCVPGMKLDNNQIEFAGSTKDRRRECLHIDAPYCNA
jgi:hypothetical protein